MLVHSFVKENHHLGIGKFYPLLVFRPTSPTTIGRLRIGEVVYIQQQ